MNKHKLMDKVSVIPMSIHLYVSETMDQKAQREGPFPLPLKKHTAREERSARLRRHFSLLA